MKLEFAMLADAATASEGRLYIHGGGITRIDVPAVPYMQPQLALVARWRTDPGDLADPHNFSIALKNPEGEYIVDPAPFGMPHDAEAPHAAEGEERYLQLALSFGPIVFDRPGVFSIELGVDGRLERTLTLPVVTGRWHRSP